MCICLGTLVIRPPETPRDRSNTPPKRYVPSADAVVKTLSEHRARACVCVCFWGSVLLLECSPSSDCLLTV